MKSRKHEEGKPMINCFVSFNFGSLNSSPVPSNVLSADIMQRSRHANRAQDGSKLSLRRDFLSRVLDNEKLLPYVGAQRAFQA